MSQTATINRSAMACLLLQHTSSAFGSAAYDFASFLFLVQIFPDTLVPASLTGLCSTACGLMFSSYIGGLVDQTHRLQFVRMTICSQKVIQALSYSLFLVFLISLKDVAIKAFYGQAAWYTVLFCWLILLFTIAAAALLKVTFTGLTVAIERDWITEIAQGNSTILTRLNTYMRRIDLFTKLIAPLVVSLLTSFTGYPIAATALLGLSVITLLTEYLWIKVVYDRFPVLDRRHVSSDNPEEAIELLEEEDDGDRTIEIGGGSQHISKGFVSAMQTEIREWQEFQQLPIFYSSVCMALIHLTTLSFDGTFISYIKSARGFDDSLIAGMRGLCLVTGLFGTAVMPVLEERVGLERAGAWSIWFEIACLAPVVTSFFCGMGKYGEHGPVWNSIILFGGIALSRIGLWSFDLCQLKELQVALDSHPKRNLLTAKQLALQNLFDLLKYALTLGASSPIHFKWTALVSWLAIFCGAISYAVYLRSVRGHLLHFCGNKKW
ncbi:uncharacterized protein L201_006431 [Kwoniella dendrophila CBS 6074]|uniref:Solute carrier family 40 member n=1 Tax=Kwoniella dendrophila CBS 6074 TaxID=1295534 RepID=A0AAX4K3V4_9TREE